MSKSKGYTVSLDEATYERLRLYSEITGKSIRSTAIEAFHFWFDTAGAAEILVETGVETSDEFMNAAPSSAPAENKIIPIESFTDVSHLPVHVGRC